MKKAYKHYFKNEFFLIQGDHKPIINIRIDHVTAIGIVNYSDSIAKEIEGYIEIPENQFWKIWSEACKSIAFIYSFPHSTIDYND